MRITIENALTEFPKHRDIMSKEVIEVFESATFPRQLKFYGKSDAITALVDEWLKQVNDILETHGGEEPKKEPKAEPKPKKEPKAEPKPKKEKKAKQPKPKFKDGSYVSYNGGEYWVLKSAVGDKGVEYRIAGVDGNPVIANELDLVKSTKKKYDKAKKDYIESQKTPVASYPLEYSLLKKYIWLHGKTISEMKSSKTYNPECTLRAIQRAIEEKKIRKESKYADEIMVAQKQIIGLLRAIDAKKLKGADSVEIDGYDKCKAIVDSMRIDDTTAISKNFISKVQEREGRKKEAENILAKLKDLKRDGDNKEVVEAMEKAINDYIDGKTDKVEAVERQLRGVLGSIASKKKGCQGLGSVVGETGLDSTISANQLLRADFDTLPFDGRWEAFLGQPSRNFKAMIYGKAGCGKSTFAIQFAKYLSKDLAMKVLYIASEEKFGYTLQEKVRRFDVSNPNISFADRLPLDITKYDVVFFDSINDMRIEPEELASMTANVASVGIFQCTKEGSFRGGADFAHDADIVVRVEDMVATTEKNRFQAGNLTFAVR